MSGPSGGGGGGDAAGKFAGYAVVGVIAIALVFYFLGALPSLLKGQGLPPLFASGESLPPQQQFRPVTGGQQYTRTPSPAQIARSVPHRTERRVASCAAGYWQSEDGWCHRERWVPPE